MSYHLLMKFGLYRWLLMLSVFPVSLVSHADDSIFWLGQTTVATEKAERESLCSAARQSISAGKKIVIFGNIPWAGLADTSELESCIGSKSYTVGAASKESWAAYLETLKNYPRNVSVTTLGHGSTDRTAGVHDPIDAFFAGYLGNLLEITTHQPNILVRYISDSCYSGSVVSGLLKKYNNGKFCSLTSNFDSDRLGSIDLFKTEESKKSQTLDGMYEDIQKAANAPGVNNESGLVRSSDVLIAQTAYDYIYTVADYLNTGKQLSQTAAYGKMSQLASQYHCGEYPRELDRQMDDELQKQEKFAQEMIKSYGVEMPLSDVKSYLLRDLSKMAPTETPAVWQYKIDEIINDNLRKFNIEPLSTLKDLALHFQNAQMFASKEGPVSYLEVLRLRKCESEPF